MARRTYAAEIRELYRGANEAKKTRSDERYRQQVLGETIRSNQEKESIQRETLNNQLNIQGSYRSRATDKTGDLERTLNTTERGQDLTYGVGMDRNSTTRRGQDINQEISYRGQDVTMRGQDITSGIAKMRDRTTQRGQNFTLDLGLQRDSTVQRGQDRNYNLGLMGNLTQRRGQDKRFELGMAGVSKDIYGIDTRADTQDKLRGHQDMMQDKRYGFEGGLIAQRAEAQKGVISHEYDAKEVLAGSDFTRLQKRDAYARETSKILQNNKLRTTERMNQLDNVTRTTLQGMGDHTKIEIAKMSLKEREKIIEAELNRDDAKVTQGLMASGSPPLPFISQEREKDYLFVTDEDKVIDEFKKWDSSQRNPTAGKQISVFNKAISLAQQKGQKDNVYTQSVIDNYLNAHENINREDMGEFFGGSDKKVKTQNAVIRTRLKQLYRAQGFTAADIKVKLDSIKDRF
jgi:hypothetical protein|tara:strand:+ start:658 stop:2037 length:1380 start_codon:yes stop_codon:yes gene_type:complete